MRNYPKIPPQLHSNDICSEVAPVVLYNIDNSEKTIIPNHNELNNLDVENQHPIEAIIGLREELDKLNNKEVVVEETDPTVPEWAKQPEKPQYTAEEVGALAADTKIPTKLRELEEDDEHLTVSITEKKKWNSGTGTGGGFSGDYNDLINKPTIPNKLSELDDDSQHRLVTDEQIEQWNKGGGSTFSGSYNDLTDKPQIPSQLKELSPDNEHQTVTAAEKELWNNSFSGDYNDLINKPTLKDFEGDSENQTVSEEEKEEWNNKISIQQSVEDAGKIFTIDIDGKTKPIELSTILSKMTWGDLVGK